MPSLAGHTNIAKVANTQTVFQTIYYYLDIWFVRYAVWCAILIEYVLTWHTPSVCMAEKSAV